MCYERWQRIFGDLNIAIRSGFLGAFIFAARFLRERIMSRTETATLFRETVPLVSLGTRLEIIHVQNAATKERSAAAWQLALSQMTIVARAIRRYTLASEAMRTLQSTFDETMQRCGKCIFLLNAYVADRLCFYVT